MIAITNDSGETLQLQPNQNLVTELNVAWLSDDELPGEFSYPIDVPLNEVNKRFVQHSYRPDLAQPRSEMPVSVRMEGVLYRRCRFSFRVNAGKLSGFLKIDSAEFYDKIRKLSLLEALTDTVFLGDGLINTPPVDLPTRLRQIAALPPGQFPCTFFPIRNEIFLEDSFDDTKLTGFVRNAYINAWESLITGQFGFPVDLPNGGKSGYLICPQFYLSYVLERIMHLANYRIESDWLASKEVQQLTVENLTAMSMAVRDLGDLVEGHKLTPGLFLPNVSISDFLKAIKGRFGLVFTFNANDRVCHITQFVQAVAAGPAIDLSEFQSGDYSTYEASGTGYAVSDYIDRDDELYNDAAGKPITPPAQLIGAGQTEISLKAGTSQLIRTNSPLGSDAHWFVPTVRQAGNVLDPRYAQSQRYLDQDGKRTNSIGIKLLSYRGMTTDSKNHPYPLATPDVRDGQQAVIGTQALALPGRHGAWQSYLRAYYYFRDQTQRITQPLLLPVGILSGLPLYRLIWLSLEDQIRRSYLISKIQADSPGPDGKVPVRLEVLTLPSGIEQVSAVSKDVVWLEFIYGPETFLTNPIRGFTVLTVKTWIDKAKTQPAIVTNLPVNIRFQVEHISTAQDAPLDVREYVQTYLANGTSTVLESAYLFNYLDKNDASHSRYYGTAISIDPGDDYNIIS